MNPSRIAGLVLGALLLIVALTVSGRLFENVGAGEIVVIQAPASGKLTWVTTPGVVWQGLGQVTSYPKRSTYEFKTQVRFNDGGHGTMEASVQWTMPLDAKNLTALHTQFGSPEAITNQLVAKVVDKSVYMTGPLMSSKESYAEKRNYLINYVEDQIEHGVYKTVQREAKVADPLSGQEKSVVIVDIVTMNNVPQRQEAAVLSMYGIATSNFSLKNLPYDPVIEKQIQQQQAITMQVQTAIAESRQAEQKAITVEQQGRANAAQAKWAQEVEKAKAVTRAEQELAVATLANSAAEQYRQTQLKKADGDAGYRRQVMAADGALDRKLQTLERINATWADAFANYKGTLVPSVTMGGGGNQSGLTSTQNFMDLLTAKSALDLGVSLKHGKDQ